jgi:hypothetical protein
MYSIIQNRALTTLKVPTESAFQPDKIWIRLLLTHIPIKHLVLPVPGPAFKFCFRIIIYCLEYKNPISNFPIAIKLSQLLPFIKFKLYYSGFCGSQHIHNISCYKKDDVLCCFLFRRFSHPSPMSNKKYDANNNQETANHD